MQSRRVACSSRHDVRVIRRQHAAGALLKRAKRFFPLAVTRGSPGELPQQSPHALQLGDGFRMLGCINELDAAILADADARLHALDPAAAYALPCRYMFGHAIRQFSRRGCSRVQLNSTGSPLASNGMKAPKAPALID